LTILVTNIIYVIMPLFQAMSFWLFDNLGGFRCKAKGLSRINSGSGYCLVPLKCLLKLVTGLNCGLRPQPGPFAEIAPKKQP
jgi:hypothetical protein